MGRAGLVSCALALGLGLGLAAPRPASARTSGAAQPAQAAQPASGPHQSTIEQQVESARNRLATTAKAPHPGKPESLTHPDLEHAGTGSASTSALAAASARPVASDALAPAVVPSGLPGLDVSGHQGNVDWGAVAGNGAQFAYVKATEGTTYFDSSYFSQQYDGSRNAGLVRGPYHFAIPGNSTGAAQADYFVANGGGWSADGKTLPGMLDVEYNPYGPVCYGLTQSQMVSWVASFDDEYRSLTGRRPTLYTTTNWWSTCTGNSASFGQDSLYIARYSDSPNPLPNGWANYTIWQFSDQGTFPGDQDVFNGSRQALADFAMGPADPVTVYYNQLGGRSSYLGSPVDDAHPIAGGQARDFTGGSIYWSAGTGAHAVHGAILAHYQSLGGPTGFLGYPVTDETGTPDGIGRYNHFSAAGSIYWTPNTGAWSIHGAIRAHWAAMGWERGPVGYPVTDETGTPDGIGRYNHFSGDGSIYWTPNTGPWSVHGAIRARWASMGWENGPVGYPTSDEYAIPDGRQSDFVSGHISWNATSGDTTVTSG